jgi:hypothetical protein
VIQQVGASPQREEQEDRRQPWSLSQRRLAYWQTREPRDKNHRVNLVHPVGLQSPKHKLVLLSHIYIVLVLLLSYLVVFV